jgi:hypothetical protein
MGLNGHIPAKSSFALNKTVAAPPLPCSLTARGVISSAWMFFETLVRVLTATPSDENQNTQITDTSLIFNLSNPIELSSPNFTQLNIRA